MNNYEAYVHSKIDGHQRKGMKIESIHTGKLSTAFRYAAEAFLEKYPEFENRHLYISVRYISVLEKVDET